MAEIHPFSALRYNPARVKLADVVTQPYDKITPEMQDRYYAASPGNLVRIILGKREGPETERDNVYTRAAGYFSEWRRGGILLPDEQPALYLYSQTFQVPGEARQLERRGFIGLGKIEEYEAGVVFRHEQTLSGPKVDRLNLLRATRAHFGQIFMLYSDAAGAVDNVLRSAAAERPDVDIVDEYGVRNLMWRITDPATVAQACALMRAKKLIIADGHHRYETALNYRNERRTALAEGGAEPDEAAPFERVMMTFVNMDSEGLLILPTHRVVFGLSGFDAVKMIEQLRRYFTVEPLPSVEAKSIPALLAEKGRDGMAMMVATAGGAALLRSGGAAQRAAAEALLAASSPRQQRLDVVQLHRLALEEVLGISAEDIRNQKHINYIRDAGEALERVRQGANAAFLMSPVPIGQMRDVAFAGEVMPQKSTDFYPKLLSGLTIYALE